MRGQGRIILLISGIASLGLPASADAARDLPSVLAEIDHAFVCPQFLPDDDARRADMMSFSRALASVGPTRVSYRQAAYIRAKMLERHNCTGGSALAETTSPATPSAAVAATPIAVSASATPN